MRKVLELNKIAIWQPIPTDDFYSKRYESSRTYMLNGDEGIASESNPVISYAKNYKKGNLMFALFLYSNATNATKIEEFFDKTVKKLTKKDVSAALVTSTKRANDFEYTEIVYQEDK